MGCSSTGPEAGRRAAEILVVEDSAADARLTIEAFRRIELPHRLHVVPSGEEALEFLRRAGPHENAPRPDLVLLDLNLPGLGGREVLAEIKHDPDLRDIPVVVLSTSRHEDDVAACYDLHANSYVVKATSLKRYFEIARIIERFWLRAVTPPPRAPDLPS